MIGTLNPSWKKVTVIGAGLSGLIIASSLRHRGYQVRVLETSDRVGGIVRTDVFAEGIAEAAAHSLLMSAPVSDFFERLGVETVGVNPNAKARFIYRDGKMRRMPLHFSEIFSTLKSFFSNPGLTHEKLSSMSLADWSDSFLGPAARQYLMSPFVTGVFACTPEELTTRLAFPGLLPQKSTSFFRHLRSKPKQPRPQMCAPKNGMGSLVQALSKDLGPEIFLNQPVSTLSEFLNREENLVLSIPSLQLASLLNSESATAVQAIPYSPLISATCFVETAQFRKPPRGVGVLIPRNQGLRTLGVLFNSSAFPNRSFSESLTSLTFMIGGTQDPDALLLTDSELKNVFEAEGNILFAGMGPIKKIAPYRWPRAIPIYGPALEMAHLVLKSHYCKTPGRMIFNNYSGAVSIRGMIEFAEKLPHYESVSIHSAHS